MKRRWQWLRCAVLVLALCASTPGAFAQAPRPGDAWSLELTVSHVVSAEAARALAQPLARLPGVTAARAGTFDHGTAKYAVSGRGREQLARLAAEIDADPALALRVSYEAPRVLQAEYDVAKAYRRKVMVLAVAPRNAPARSVLPELVRASLLNLPFLEMAHSLPLLTTPDDAEAAEARLRAKADKLHIPLLLRATLARGDGGASAKLRLLESGSGLTVVASGGEAQSVASAFDGAVRSLDAQFRVAVGHPEVRQRLGMQSLASSLERDSRLAIRAFEVPTLSEPAQLPAPALLVVHNDSQEPVSDGRVTLSAGERELAQTALPELAPGETRELSLPLEPAAQLTQTSLPLTAAVTYEQAGAHRRVSAVSSLIRVGAAADGGEPQTPAPPPGYSALLREGVQRHVDGEWRAARALFLRAHRLFPSARTLRSLGMVEFDLGHYAGSVEYLTRALTASVRPLALDQRAEVRRLLSQVRASASPRAVAL
jgi:hypothetical protein